MAWRWRWVAGAGNDHDICCAISCRVKTILQAWSEYSHERKAKHMQLARAGAKARQSILQRSFIALQRSVLQAEEMADASEGFLQECQVKPEKLQDKTHRVC